MSLTATRYAPASRPRPRRLEAGALGWSARRAALRVAAHERRRPEHALPPAAERGLGVYLDGPLRLQVKEELGGEPERLTFVFGHTHKPFERSWTSPAFARPVELFNTGGWVVDSDVPEPHQGGAVVMMGDDLEVVSLRCYNRSPQHGDYKVSVATMRPAGDRPLYDRVDRLVLPDHPPWSRLARTCAELVTQRHHVLDEVIEEGSALTRAGTTPG